ncbi:hypothetical protein HHI36_007204 [Cryptolaemus montrouzieri]|uniref:Cytoplasmic tRNA 2-thiolation protein 2 n=1 Tax=Cryptolaemus montrouzieri TaxID=559131 RepID=A0ABD2MNV1_9CUCU
MCSNNGGVDIEDIISNSVHSLKLKSQVLSDKCNKCKEEKPCLTLRNKDVYCKSCFMSTTLHKFKALLGKYRLIRDNDKVLIYYKGGHATTALLKFMRTCLDLDTPKKLRFQPLSLFIRDQNSLSKLS